MTEKQPEEQERRLAEIRERWMYTAMPVLPPPTQACADVAFLLSLLQQPATSEQCGGCGHERRYFRADLGHCIATVTLDNYGAAKDCGCKCVFPATGAAPVSSLPVPTTEASVLWAVEADLVADTLRELSDRFNGVDNGYCTICRQHRLYDIRGKVGPCENAKCLSHRIGSILERYEKPSEATLKRMKRRCLEQIKGDRK